MRSIWPFISAILVVDLALAMPTVNTPMAIDNTPNPSATTQMPSFSGATPVEDAPFASGTVPTATTKSDGMTGGAGFKFAAMAISTTASTMASTTVNSTAISTGTSIPLVPNTLSIGITNSTQGCSPCYCEGETWDDLGTWDQINHELQNSRIVRVTYIPAGYHVSEPISVNNHCFVFEIGVDKGNAYDLNPQAITKLLQGAHDRCPHGGRSGLDFLAPDGDIQGRGWVKADPQRNPDCS